MKLSTIRRILKEDLSRAGEVPKFVDAMLPPLNEFIDQVVSSLRNNLTFADNFACKIVKQKVLSNTVYPINPQSKVRVSGVQLIDAGGALVSDFGWVRRDDGTIGIKVKFSEYVDGTAIAGTTDLPMTFVIQFG